MSSRSQTHLLALCLALATLLPARVGAAEAHESVGWQPTAIPLWNFSSDDGTGYGLRANLYEYDGVSVPYLRKYSGQLFFTTGGKWVHRLQLDTPNFRGSNQRLEAELVYEKEEFANYYGGLPKADTDERTRDQKTFSQAFPELTLKWIRELRGPWRLRLGGRLSHNTITPNAEAGSILRELKPIGADGGTLFQVNGSLRYDRRDNYNNTTSGRFEELLVEYGVGAGGDFNGVTASFEHRQFLSLHESVVAAHRVSVDWTFGDLPFYEALELGGSSTVRGVAQARERGEARVLGNGELRWRGVGLSRSRHMYLGLLAFVDVGQIFARDVLPATSEWQSGAGVGMRYQWHSTIVRADYGSSGGNTGIYITFSQVF